MTIGSRSLPQVLLFMKGDKIQPQCGFSNTAVMILKAVTESAGCDFQTFNVLADNDVRRHPIPAPTPASARRRRAPAAYFLRARASPGFVGFVGLVARQVREGIKKHSNWPTIPQCYIDGEFVGGCDLLIEMYQNGELAEMVEKAAAS